MVKKPEPLIPKDRVSIVISREDRRHLGFIALERDFSSASEAVSYLLSYFDRSGKLKRQREPEIFIDHEGQPPGIRII